MAERPAARRPRGPGGPAGEPGAHEWITVAEAAQRCGVHPVTLRRAARVGNLEARASGKVWLTTRAAVRAWLASARHRTGPKPGEGLGRPRRAPADGGAPAPPSVPEETPGGERR
jgi:excisionase family DNA binding protein